MWTCSKCGEKHENQFEQCWHCGTSRDGTTSPNLEFTEEGVMARKDEESESDLAQKSLNWFEIWRIAVLHPTVKSYSEIINNPKASIKWGTIWIAISTFIAWFTGPQRSLLIGIVWDNFGLKAVPYFLIIGAVISTVFGVIVLLITSAISHRFAVLFGGEGTFHQLVYGWAVIQPPFILLSGLATHFPSIFPSSRSFFLSTAGWTIMIISLLMFIGINLYQLYAGVVAFSAVEKLGIWKSFGILILQAVVVGIAVTCLSSFQALIMNFTRLY